MRAIGCENARAAVFGPMLATEISASKNSRSIGFVKPKNVNRPLLPSRLKAGINFKCQSLAGRSRQFFGDAGRHDHIVAEAADVDQNASPRRRSISVPEMRENTVTRFRRAPNSTRCVRCSLGRGPTPKRRRRRRDAERCAKRAAASRLRLTCSLRAAPEPVSARLTCEWPKWRTGTRAASAARHKTPRAWPISTAVAGFL